MRLFFGLSLSEEARREAAALARQAEALIPGRYALADNYHLTLAFLGEVPQSQLETAHQALACVAARHPAPAVVPERLDFFGRAQNGILILRCQSSPALSALHTDLTDALGARSLPFSPGPFSPHITLARHARIEEAALSSLPCAVPTFTPACAHVYLSARDEQNILRYTPLFNAPFLG